MSILYTGTMKLIVGLGNAESKYDGTRHNVGFWCVEQFAASRGLSFAPKDKLRARIAEFGAGDDKVIVAQPTTYYNMSGEAVRAIAGFYHITPHAILLIYDEMSLPFGTIRTRRGGSDAGNNGVKSITQHIGPETARLRIGTATELRERMDDADFVLSRFTASELSALADRLPKLYSLIDSFIDNTFDITTHVSI